MASAMDDQTSLVYVCNPNNPTGTLIDPVRLRSFVAGASTRAVVFVDEAYVEFQDRPSEHALTDMVRAGSNVVVARTFSKLHGMAGLRVGYAIAPNELASQLRATKMTLPNGPGLAAAAASYADVGRADEMRQRIVSTRQWFVGQCAQRGLNTAEPAGNFVFVNVGMDTTEFRAGMRSRGIRVGRPFAPYDQWSRITVGTPTQMQRLVEAMDGILQTS